MGDLKRKILVISVGIIVLVVSLFACLYRRDAQIEIEDRWWTFYRKYTYNVTTTEPETVTTTYTDLDGKQHTKTETKLVTKTETYTRCSATAKGKELPAVPPTMPCYPLPGDSTSDWKTYHIKYHESEQNKSKFGTIRRNAWNDFEPGAIVDVKFTIAGFVDSYKVKRRSEVKG